VNLLDVPATFSLLGLESPDLVKLNIEGAEFGVLERMIATSMIARIKNIQCQWHDCAPDAQRRYDWLQAELAKTHELTFDAQWIWQSWAKR
jgi:hypothetical protein